MGFQDFVLRNFLILGLLTVIAFGLLFPAPGLALGRLHFLGLTLPDVAVCAIFLLSGLALDSLSEGLQARALTIGAVLVLVVTPLMAIPIVSLSAAGFNALLLQGMALFCVVPTTLSSGVTMIAQAKGNVSLAILLTTVTNVLGVFTLPLSAARVFSAEVAVRPESMLRELVCLTLLPLCGGMLLKRALLSEPVKRNKRTLGLLQNSCILLVVLLMVSKARAEIVAARPMDLSLCLAMAAGVHLAYRAVACVVASAAGLAPQEWVAVVLMGSQKSLPVCVSVLQALPEGLRRRSGVFIVPCVVGHAAQLILDSVLAVRWQVAAEAGK